MGHCRTEHSEDANCCETEQGHCHDQASGHEDEACDIAEGLLGLAKSAQKKLLKEKMERLIEAKIGKKLDEVAEAAVDALLAHWQQKVAAKQSCEKYQEKLMAAFKG